VNIPGEQGAMGINAYTSTTQDFTVPLGDNSTLATIEVEETRWMVPGQPIFIQSAGTFVVSSTPNNTTVNVVNPGTSGNVPEGTVIVAGMKIGAGGFGTGGAGSNVPSLPSTPGRYNIVVPSVGAPFWDNPSGDSILSFGLSISSPVVVGAPYASVNFTATANTAPTSASVSWSGAGGSGTQGVTVGTTMMGTIVGPFEGTSNGATLTVVLTCIFPDGTQMSTATLVWNDRTYQGYGPPSGNGALATGTSANLEVASSPTGYLLTGTAPVSNTVGAVFTVTVPSGPPLKVYDLTPHTATPHTYQDAVYNVPIGMNAPTTISFTNENGITESWDLYESTYALIGTYNIKRAT
jgi:hypothetical protein